jgi:hypothetical protein
MSDEMQNTDQSTEEAVEQQSVSFQDSLSDELKADPSLQDFKDVESLAKSYVSAQRMLGNSIRIPGEDAGEEARDAFYEKLQEVPGVAKLPDLDDADERNNFYNKLGRPEQADGYKYDIPEGLDTDPDQLGSFSQIAHEIGLTKEQANKLVGFEIQRQQQVNDQYLSARDNAEEALREKWGADFDTRLQGAKAARDMYAQQNPAAMEQIINSELGNNPVIVELFSQAYVNMQEEGHVGATSNLKYGITPEEALEQIQEIRDNSAHAFHHAEDPGHTAAVEKMKRLYSSAYHDEG